jgi:subtilisin family serine protease
MKKPVILVSLIVAIAAISYLISLYPKDSNQKDKQSIGVIIKFKENVVNPENQKVNVEDINSIEVRATLEKFRVLKLESVFKNRYRFGKLEKSVYKACNLLNYRKLSVKGNKNAEKLVQSLGKLNDIEDAFIEEPIKLKPAIIPNDLYYGSQWHLNSSLRPYSDIDAEQAWNINKGRNDVVIAVCDGGVDYTHPDLDPGNRSRVIAGYDSADDDYDPIDDLSNSAPQSYAGHGTNVAGVIGAITDNSNQVAGAMWNCKIMPIKMVGSGEISNPFGGSIVDFSETALPSDVADGIDYAVSHGADIINLSYGFEGKGFPIDQIALRIPLLYDVISNAYKNNITITASMGNEYDEGNPTTYPAAFSHEVIAVGATDQFGQKASFSNTGKHINVTAPGVGIYTTDRFTGVNNPSGTSFSAPLVAGVAGLIISQGKDRGFNLTNDDIRHILEITADDITPVGFDEATGYGKVNAHRALELLDEPNELYHWSSKGGSTTKANLSKWVFISNRWGLSAGIYYDVDRYEINKHIDFPTPFCSTPEVWIRDRECTSMNFSNPNDGFPFAQITNVSKTGFDVRYAVYYVRKNSAGQAVNKWIPTSTSLSKIEYTAVGRLNSAGNAGTVSGVTPVCTSFKTFKMTNFPAGADITWSKSNNLSYVGGQGTNAYQVKSTSSSNNSEGWIKANINTGCGNVVYEKTVWVGKPDIVISGDDFLQPMSLGMAFIEYTSSPQIQGSPSIQWSYTGPLDYITGTITHARYRASRNGGVGNIYVLATNQCGSYETRLPFEVEEGFKMRVSPVPASSELTVEIIEDKEMQSDEQMSIEIFDKFSQLKLYEETKSKKHRINICILPPDIYVLKVKKGDIIKTEKILIE